VIFIKMGNPYLLLLEKMDEGLDDSLLSEQVSSLQEADELYDQTKNVFEKFISIMIRHYNPEVMLILLNKLHEPQIHFFTNKPQPKSLDSFKNYFNYRCSMLWSESLSYHPKVLFDLFQRSYMQQPHYIILYNGETAAHDLDKIIDAFQII
jgi:hypothetical protein